MNIDYQFDADKAVAVMVAILRHTGTTDKLKLIKLIYLADRDCFLKFGHPITGDHFVAMNHGPVPSGCLNVLNDQIPSDVFLFLHINDRKVSLDSNPPEYAIAEFSQDETSIIENTLSKYGNMTTSEIYSLVHKLPEYMSSYISGTSTDIQFERILQHHGTKKQFRHGRAVITRQMRKHLACPFPQSESPI